MQNILIEKMVFYILVEIAGFLRAWIINDRYISHVGVLPGMDKMRFTSQLFLPYRIKDLLRKIEVEIWPSIAHTHLGKYLLQTPSPYTSEELELDQ